MQGFALTSELLRRWARCTAAAPHPRDPAGKFPVSRTQVGWRHLNTVQDAGCFSIVSRAQLGMNQHGEIAIPRQSSSSGITAEESHTSAPCHIRKDAFCLAREALHTFLPSLSRLSLLGCILLSGTPAQCCVAAACIECMYACMPASHMASLSRRVLFAGPTPC